MFLKEIKLRNIRSYSFQTISFPKGKLLLTGDIGAGKSTILLAIEFAFFGLRRDVNGDSLQRKDSNESYVELSFVINEKEYMIHRSLKRTKKSIVQGNCFIIENSQKTILTPEQLKKKVYEILNYPSQTMNEKNQLVFRYTCYTPQEMMKTILLDKDSCYDNLKKIFNIEKYSRIKDNNAVFVKSLKNNVRVEKAKLNYFNDIRQEKKNLSDEKAIIQEKQKNIEKELKEKKHFIEELSEKFLLLEEKNKKSYELNLNLENLKKQKKDLETQLNEINLNIDSINKKLKSIKIDTYGTDLGFYENKKKEIDTKILQLQNENKISIKEIHDLEKEISSINGQISSFKDNFKRISEIQNKLVSLEKKIKTIFEEFDSLFLKIENKKEQFEQNNFKEIKENKTKVDFEKALNKFSKLIILINKHIQENEGNKNIYVEINEEENSLILSIQTIKKFFEDFSIILENEKFNINQKNDALKKALNTFELKIEHIEHENKEIMNLSTCPKCHQKITSEYKESLNKSNIEKRKEFKNKEETKKKLFEKHNSFLNFLESLIRQLNIFFKNIENLESNLSFNFKELNNYLENGEGLNQKIFRKEQINKNLVQLKKNQDELESKLSKLAKQSEKYQEIMKKINLNLLNQKEKSLLEKNLANLETNRQGIDKKIGLLLEEIEQEFKKLSILDEDLKDYQSIKTKIENEKKEFENLQINFTKLNSQEEFVLKSIKKLEEDEKRKNQLVNKINSINSLIGFLEDQFKPVIDLMEKKIYGGIYYTFNEYFKHFFDIILLDETIDAQLDEFFSPRITIDGYDISYESLSGGEKTSLALAYRVALNSVLNDLFSNINTRGFLILDEPTDGFSNDQLDNLKNLLDSLDYEQMIIVSHEPKVESFVNAVIKIRKENNISLVE